MQISAINSVNFKGFQDENFEEIEKAINAAKVIEHIKKSQKEDSYENSDKDNEPTKKNFFETAISIVGTAVAAFFLTRKMYNKGMPAIKEFFDKNQNKIKELLNKLPQKVKDIKNAKPVTKAEDLGNRINNFVNEKFVNKIGNKANAVGVIGAVAGTTYVATTDSNDNGIADIAEKGVNAYKGAIQKFGHVAEAIKVLT